MSSSRLRLRLSSRACSSQKGFQLLSRCDSPQDCHLLSLMSSFCREKRPSFLCPCNQEKWLTETYQGSDNLCEDHERDTLTKRRDSCTRFTQHNALRTSLSESDPRSISSLKTPLTIEERNSFRISEIVVGFTKKNRTVQRRSISFHRKRDQKEPHFRYSCSGIDLCSLISFRSSSPVISFACFSSHDDAVNAFPLCV